MERKIYTLIKKTAWYLILWVICLSFTTCNFQRSLFTPTAIDTPSPTLVTITKTLEYTAPNVPSFTPTSNVIPASATLTQIPEPSPTSTITPTLPCSTILEYEGGGALWRNLSMDPRGDIWLRNHYNSIAEYSHGRLLKEVNLEGKIKSLVDMQVSSSDVWILDLDGWPEGWPIRKIVPKVVRLGFDGNVTASYDIPTKLLLDPNGEPVDYGLRFMRWGEKGELLLFGPAGSYQLLDNEGNISINRFLNGWTWGGHLYRVIQSKGDRIGTQKAKVIVAVDKKEIEITSSVDHISLDGNYPGISWILSDGSFFVVFDEYNTSTIQHYSLSGEFLGSANIPTSTKCFSCITNVTVGNDGKVYALIEQEIGKQYEVRELCLH